MYIGDYLARRCVYAPEAVAVIDAGSTPRRRITYGALDARATALARHLRGRGIARGDRIAMLAHDGVHFYDAFFACGKLGAVFVPLNWRLHPREVETMIAQVTPKLLFFDPELAAQAAHLGELPDLPALEVSSIERITSTSAAADPVTCESLTEADTACLLFTGGTTGLPKAAQISHKQIVWNTLNTHLADIQGSDIFVNVFPLFHTGGLFAFTLPLLILGGTVVQTRRFHADEVLELIDSERATIFAGVPTMFQMLTAAASWPDCRLDSLRFCMSGGAPMPVPLIERYQRDKGVVFRQGFGMTEFGPGIFSLAAADAIRKAGSVGKPNYFVDARVVDVATGERLAPGEVGELLLRGPTVTSGYFADPEATRAAFDDDGFFHTGDMARIDDDGYFYIVDRLKDMFVSGGENVYPAEIEAVLYEHSEVTMAAVVGVPDARWGEVGIAFVVGAADPEAGLSDRLLEYLGTRLARYKIPRTIHVVDSLPTSGAGKILKTELRKQVKA